MAVGRQDYQAGVVPVKSGYSLAQEVFFKYEFKNITTLTSEDLCEYTVPTGYRLNICGFRITTTLPFIHIMDIVVETTAQFFKWFNTEINDNFPEGVTLTVEAGETVKVQIQNRDSVTGIFEASLYGYLEQIET